jgi:hypothetical protein
MRLGVFRVVISKQENELEVPVLHDERQKQPMSFWRHMGILTDVAIEHQEFDPVGSGVFCYFADFIKN